MEYPLSYREVIPEQQQFWKEINLNIGGTQSTLQDIKVPERANGYCYRDATKYHTRNRFIYWRINHNVLDLVEHSLDVNLSSNKMRYKFSDAPILGGISVHETFYNVVVLVPTVCSVHRLIFPHPDRLHVPGDVLNVHPDLSVPSIFADVSQANNKSIFYVYNNPDSQLPYIAASALTSDEAALFLFAYASGDVRLVRHIISDEVAAAVGDTLDLRRDARLPKFLTGLADKLRRGAGGATAGGAGGGGGGGAGVMGGVAANPDSVVSVLLHTIGVQTYAMALCRDGRIQVWACAKGQHVADSDVLADCVTDRLTVPGAHNHVLQRVQSKHDDRVDCATNGILAVFLSFANSSQFHILRPIVSGTQFQLERIATVDSPMADLVDFSLTPSRLWGLYRDDMDGQSAAAWSVCMDIDENSTEIGKWQPVVLEPMLPSDEIIVNPDLDAKQNYLDFIFYPGRFPLTIISKALSIYKRSAILGEMSLSSQNLRQRVCMAVEAEILNELAEDEVTDEDYQETASWCWSRFYSCCVQYYMTGLRPLGLLLLPSVSGAVLIKKDSYSIVRPLDIIEHLALCNKYSIPEQFEHCSEIANVQEEIPDLINLIDLLMQVDELLFEESKRKLDKECFTSSPDEVVKEMLPELSQEFEEFELEESIGATPVHYANLPLTIHNLLTLLTLGTTPIPIQTPPPPPSPPASLYPNLSPSTGAHTPAAVAAAAAAATTHTSDDDDDDDDTSIEPMMDDGVRTAGEVGGRRGQEQEEQEAVHKRMRRVKSLFSSPLGVGVVGRVLYQRTELRYSLCRSLLILHAVVLDENGRFPASTAEDSSQMQDALRAVCVPKLVELLRCYHAQNWLIGSLCAMPVLPTESMLQRFSSLNLSSAHSSKTINLKSTLLFEHFAYSKGGEEARWNFASLNNDYDTLAHWHSSMLPYLDVLMQIVWPINGNLAFPEWLLVSGQHLRLHQYVSLLYQWCKPGDLSRSFILGLSFLATGEKRKACDSFLGCSKGIFSEQYIKDCIPHSSSDGSAPYVYYYLKIIHLFELYGYVDCAIECARSVLSIEDMDMALNATLHSILFKHQLALGHFQEAYEALVENPDAERKKNNLRDLVKNLLDQKQLNTLISFPYSGMEKLFCTILFTRARATDRINNIYYDFLYAFQVKRGPEYIRLAANVMYEQAYRLLQYNTVEALEKQVKCYLAAVNALNLTEKRWAWVLKPADPDLEEMTIKLPAQIIDGERSEELELKLQTPVDVLDLEGVKKELELAKARLRLAKFAPKAMMNHLTHPEELVLLLVNYGLFKTALLLCKRFAMAYDAIFQSLTQRCIKLTKKENPKSWNWLAENNLQELDFIGNTPSEAAWNLLRSFLVEYEEPKMSVLHKVVVKKMIEMSAFVPYWVVASYKLRNPAELLRLYYFNGYLYEAVDLAKDHLLAALGHGGEHFGFTSSIGTTGEAFCLPLNIIEALLAEIDAQNKIRNEKPFAKQHVELQIVFKKYLDAVEQLSKEYVVHQWNKHRQSAS